MLTYSEYYNPHNAPELILPSSCYMRPLFCNPSKNRSHIISYIQYKFRVIYCYRRIYIYYVLPHPPLPAMPVLMIQWLIVYCQVLLIYITQLMSLMYTLYFVTCICILYICCRMEKYSQRLCWNVAASMSHTDEAESVLVYCDVKWRHEAVLWSVNT